MENWVAIDGFDMYEVSNMGNVRSWKNARHGRAHRPHPLSPGINGHGYRQVTLYSNKMHKTLKVSVLVASAFIGSNPGGCDVNHIDGDKQNDVPGNLEWCSRSENISHAYRIGLARPMRGELCGNSKLTAERVVRMRELYAEGGYSTRALGLMFGVCGQTVSKIVTGKTWTHV